MIYSDFCPKLSILLLEDLSYSLFTRSSGWRHKSADHWPVVSTSRPMSTYVDLGQCRLIFKSRLWAVPVVQFMIVGKLRPRASRQSRTWSLLPLPGWSAWSSGCWCGRAPATQHRPASTSRSGWSCRYLGKREVLAHYNAEKVLLYLYFIYSF